ncbi:hypothetical protein Taro_016344 [Colocasia esculenta]|uniref:Uncharacterized protein n=1 Tax=Colocasia esculenta TaxID=4460 RepID=A0A843UDK8_COLES|nr:hypothetical protein [Colocasia esculenta]
MEWSLLTSGMGRRRLSPSRSGHDGEVRRDLNRCAVFKQGGQTELSQALLDQGRSCCSYVGRFGVSTEFSSRSRREDVARSGGNAAPCVDYVFFMKATDPAIAARSRQADPSRQGFLSRHIVASRSEVGHGLWRDHSRGF